MTPVRILIADSRPVTRGVLSALASSQGDWQVCGEAADGNEVLEKANQLEPDVIVVDIDLPSSGLDVVRRMATNVPNQKSIVLAASEEATLVRKVFDSGAYGFLLKANAPRDLVAAIERVKGGRTYYSTKAAESVLQDCLSPGCSEEELTTRQREILNLLAKDYSGAFSPSHHRKIRRRPRFAFAAASIAVIVLSLGLIYARGARLIDRSLKSLGLKPPASQASNGNPDTKVWIDLRTALYYCPGEPQYAKHPNGRLARQIDAELDHFEPASRKPCK